MHVRLCGGTVRRPPCPRTRRHRWIVPDIDIAPFATVVCALLRVGLQCTTKRLPLGAEKGFGYAP